MTLTQETLDLIERLKTELDGVVLECIGNERSWEMQEGCLISYNEAKEIISIISSLKGEEWVDEVKKIVKNIGEGEPVSFGNYHKGACYIKMKSGNRYVISIRYSQQMTLD